MSEKKITHPIRCFLIDDEPLALDLLRDYVNKIDFLEYVGATTDAISAFETLREEQVDLLFLDIQMPDIDGIQFMKILQNKCKVILTTAYDQYALEGYKHSVIDYLMKPISFNTFYESAVRARAHFPEVQAIENDFFFVKTDGKLVMVQSADLLYIEGLKDYILIHLVDEKLVVLENLKDIEAKLSHLHFMRIHKSYIVRLDRIQSIEGNRVFIDSKEIPIGETYKKSFFNWVAKNK